jgi:hypothetical protein
MKKHLNYANAMATIAVFVALGGTSYAAVKISGSDVRNGSLTGTDVKDRSLSSKDLKKGAVATTRWLLINEAGDIDEQSGGFTVISKPGTNGQPATNPNIYVDAGSSLVGKGLAATIAIQNLVDRDGNGTADPAFKGDAAVGRCNTPVVGCVPMGTNTDNVLVVRALADNSAAGSQTRRVHVQVMP